MKKLLTAIALSSLSLTAFAEYNTLSESTTDVSGLQGTGLYVTASATIKDADGTTLILETPSLDDCYYYETGDLTSALYVDRESAAVLTISSNVTIKNTLADYALYLPWKTNVTIASGATLYLEGTGGNAYISASATNFTINGTYIADGLTTLYGAATIKLNSAGVANFNGGLTINATGGSSNFLLANSDTDNSFTVKDNTINILSAWNYAAIMTICDGDALADKIINIGTDSSTTTNNFKLQFATWDYSTVLAENTTVEVGTINIGKSATLTLDLGGLSYVSGTSAIIDTITVADNSAQILILNFADDLIAFEQLANVTSISEEVASVKITNVTYENITSFDVTIDGEDVTIYVNTEYVEGNSFVFDENGFLSYTSIAVPEPSTYAAIFGALALSLAIYRRRK